MAAKSLILHPLRLVGRALERLPRDFLETALIPKVSSTWAGLQRSELAPKVRKKQIEAERGRRRLFGGGFLLTRVFVWICSIPWSSGGLALRTGHCGAYVNAISPGPIDADGCASYSAFMKLDRID